jgi:hypothetical protein
MLRFYVPIAMLGGIAALVACSGREPVAAEANNTAAAPSDVDVLPPDESAATPTNDLENGDDEDVNVDDAAAGNGAIPTAFRGRWAMTPADCTRPVVGGEGGLLITGNELRFYQSVARPVDVRATGNSIAGRFTFRGEGSRWTRHEVIEIRDHKLVRTESGPMASYTYARCES